ncbi:uncharacterized protein LOC110974890 [Acanthaster planci]|uniref:Uncharacterized protein LOC110974890 n=1 Tax=Acanthaster planci TaxID=133434 RepID=A0A8B7XNX2_ACAPL|nr:uncharacterized protein LOC110974890 [Acanthaster planci]
MADESHGISSTVEDSLQSPPAGRESCLPRHRAPREESSVSVGEISVTGNNNPVLCGSDGNTLNFQKSADSDPKVLSTSTTSADETSGPLVLSKKSTSSQQREISTGEETIEDTLPPTPPYTRSSTRRVESLKIAGHENFTFVNCSVNIMNSSADSGIGDSFSSVDTSVGSDSRTSLTNHEVTGGKKETIDEGVIFLIDCYDPMFQQSKDGEDSPFQLTIKIF